MVLLSAPPIPPKSVLSTEDQIQTFTQMLKSLEESAKYQKEAIEYHTESLELLEEESKNTKAQLDLCRNTINTLSQTQQLVTSASSTSSKKSKNGQKTTKSVDKKATTVKKAKSSSKTKSTKAISKKPQSSKQKKESTTKKAVKQGQKKTKSTLPPSSVLKKYENITAMVLDFVQKKDGVIDVSQIIKYVYPKGLSKENRKKAFSSFSSVLSLSMKKGILERTVPGKYRWIGK